MSQKTAASEARSRAFFMFLSAGIFAYFGFGSSWAHEYTTDDPPKLLMMVALLKWTLRCGAIAFGIAATLSAIGSFLGLLIDVVAGLFVAAIFVVVGAWEMTNSQGYFSGVPAIVLFLLAAWNGYGSVVGLREWLASRAVASQATRATSPN